MQIIQMYKFSQSHVTETIGGISGHLLRRIIHLSTALIPFWYYNWGHKTANFLHLTLTELLLLFFVINLMLEMARLMQGWTLPGHRHFEAKRISSFFWGIAAIISVLLLAPSPAFGMPLIWSTAIADPLLGELRRLTLKTHWVVMGGLLAVLLCWWLATFLFGTPWWYALLMSPLTIFLEWPNLKWIDDNALMLLLPLGVILLFN